MPPIATAPPRPAARLAIVLTAVQCLSTLAWTLYATVLPGLLSSAGLPLSAKPWILLADVAVFAACDLLAGAWLDRAAVAVRRLGGAVLAALSVGTLAFVAMPRVVHGPGAAPLLLAAIAVWVVASGALRAPLPRLLSRYASLPDRPRLGAFLAVGSGLAGALLPPSLDLLRAVGPTAAFVLSGVTLWLLAGVLFVVERTAAPPRSPPPATPSAAPGGCGRIVAATALATLAMQLTTALAMPALLRRFVSAAEAGDGAAVFGVGVALSVIAAPAVRSLRAASLVGALAALGAWLSPSLAALVTALAAMGLAWGTVLTASLAAVTGHAAPDRASRWTGAWFAAQSAAVGARLLVVLATGGVSTAAACAAAVGLWAAAGVAWPRAAMVRLDTRNTL